MMSAYPAPRRALHWLTLALLAALYAMGWVLEDVESAATRKLLMTAHQSLGLLVVILALVRLAAAWRMPFRPADEIASWMERLAGLTHAALYLLMIALPLSGWAYTTIKGGSVNFFWLGKLPHLFGEDDNLADSFFEAHELIGIALLALVALHAAAALFHHLVLRDAVLARMLPILRRA